MEKIYEFEFNSFPATVIVPEHPNGKWIWKTEFLYAFDAAERALLEEGYTRVYYQISDMYGSPRSVELMKNFHAHVTERFSLDKRAVLFGFSRGGLYAFNFVLAHPDKVSKIYLDAPFWICAPGRRRGLYSVSKCMWSLVSLLIQLRHLRGTPWRILNVFSHTVYRFCS